MDFLEKLKLLFKKPRVVIVVVGSGRSCTQEAISQVLKKELQKGLQRRLRPSVLRKPEVFILESDLKDKKEIEKLKILIGKSPLSIFVVTHLGEIPFDRDYFAADKEKTKEIEKFAKTLPFSILLILNFDDETVREITDVTNLKTLTFGFQEGAEFQASDININGWDASSARETGEPVLGTNFKINFKGNIVPVWLEGLFGKEQIYSALAAACVGKVLDLNLVELSQALKDYRSLPGKMQLVKGIKNSRILDDSEGASVFSMIEAIEILGKIQGFKRKVAVLGDIIGVGKYTIEAHEAIGEKVERNAELLFVFGPRARFIAEAAKNKGMSLDKIFQFDTINDGKLKLSEEIKEGDLILVDGSTEMKMGEIVKEITERR